MPTNKDKKGSDTTNVKLDAIARRLTELQKQKEPAIQNSNTKDDNVIIMYYDVINSKILMFMIILMLLYYNLS